MNKAFRYLPLFALALIWGLLGPSVLLGQNTNSADTNKQTNALSRTSDADSDGDKDSSDSARPRRWRMRHRDHEGVSRDAVVVFGRNVELKEGENAEAVVVIGGSAKIRGKVDQAVTVIGGNIDVDGEIGQAAVAVLGNIKIGPTAVIQGDVVSVGGKTDIADGATVEGHTQEVDFGSSLPPVQWLKNWVVQCLFKLRILSPQIGWVWGMWAALLLIYLLIATVFPRPVQACRS